jgi:hypothetical protein
MTCEGNRDEIDGELKRLPERERKAVQQALERLTKPTPKTERPGTGR